ncbi:hypothetical protein GCM10009113_04080 [Marinobacter szutsaonensis]
MNKINVFVASALTIWMSNSAVSAPIFKDSFETGDLQSTNSTGFFWQGSGGRTAVVTEAAKDGNYSLLFNYPAGEPWTEQRFSLGSSYPDLWVSFWIRVPQNFYHPATSPSNNKFFAIWMDDYSSKGDGPTAFWNIFSNGSGGSQIAYSYSEGSYQVGGPQSQFKEFIRVPDDRGRWMKVVIHVKASSTPGESDGVIELWRRWENESEFTKYHEDTNANLPIPSGGPDGWSVGYLMGWANAEYESETKWFLDEFVVSDSSLINGDVGSGSSVAPNPPELDVQ